jgi:hypothetical protein
LYLLEIDETKMENVLSIKKKKKREREREISIFVKSR